MSLADRSETIALQPLGDPQFPQRLAAIELLRHDSPGQPLELLFPAGTRQRRMAHVVVEVEALIVNPDRMVLDRHARDPLPITGNLMQPRSDVAANPFDIDPAARGPHRLRVEDHHPRDVHVSLRTFKVQKRPVQNAQPLIFGHREAAPLPRYAPVLSGNPPR